MSLSWDGQYLITGAEDGSVFMMRVKDKNVEEINSSLDPKKQQQINQKGEEKLRTSLI